MENKNNAVTYKDDEPLFCKVYVKEEPHWPETVSSEIKLESDETWISDLAFENKADFVQCNGGRCSESTEIETKVEIKEESSWVERSLKIKSQPEAYKDLTPEFWNITEDAAPCITEINEDILHTSSRLHTEEGRNERSCDTGTQTENCLKVNEPGGFKVHSSIHHDREEFTHIFDLEKCNVTAKKTFKCEICDKRFPGAWHLKRHKLTHEGKVPHKCELCAMTFNQMTNLKIHYLIHEGKKPHKCEICDKSFTHLSGLRMHNLIHEGKRSYKCEICEKRFTRLSHLKSHFVYHEDKKPHICDICNKGFTRISELKMHLSTHEVKIKHTCELCGKSFNMRSRLKRHELIHENKRVDSNENYNNNSNLKMFNLTPGDEKLQCEILRRALETQT